MSLIIGKYYGGDPRVKPDQWGPAEDVQAAIRENADGMGINPASFLAYAPVWEGCSQAKDIFGSTREGTQNWKNWSTQTMNGTNQHFGLTAPGNKWLDYLDDFTLVFIGEPIPGAYVDHREVFGIGRSNALSSSVRIGIKRSGTTEDRYTLYAFDGDSPFIDDANFDFATITNRGDTSWGKLYYKNKIVADLTTSHRNTSYDLGHIRVGNRSSGDDVPSLYNPVKEFKGIILLKGVLTDSQIAHLSDNPYALIQPIVRRFYSIPSGAGDIISAACTDGFAFADSATKTAILHAAAVESISLSDSDENVAQFIAALVDSFTMVDLSGNTAKYPVTVSDTFSISDSTIALQKVIALVSDNVTFSDVSVVRADLTGIAEDNVTFAETLIANLHAQAIASEIINLSDSVNAELLGDLLAYVTETFNMSDSTTARADLVVLITDAFDLSDAATNTLQAYVTATDGFTVSDTAFWAGVTQAIASDSFTVSGSVTGLIKLLAQAAETINFSDSGSVTATYNVQVNDAVEFATAISTIAQFRAAVADGFNVTATAMEVSQLPNGKVSVSFSMKTATVVFNIK